jgi:hypothetical protein
VRDRRGEGGRSLTRVIGPWSDRPGHRVGLGEGAVGGERAHLVGTTQRRACGGAEAVYEARGGAKTGRQGFGEGAVLAHREELRRGRLRELGAHVVAVAEVAPRTAELRSRQHPHAAVQRRFAAIHVRDEAAQRLFQVRLAHEGEGRVEHHAERAARERRGGRVLADPAA